MSFLSFIKNWFFGETKKLKEKEYTKSRKFEIFICKYFKDSGEFDLLRRPNEYIKGIKSEEDTYPDCKLKDKRSNKTFWVECKWRPEWNKRDEEEVTFFEKDKIEFYKKIQKEGGYKIFIALGIGIGEETIEELRPRELYFFPLNMFSKYIHIRKRYLVENDRQHNFKYCKPKFFTNGNDLK